METRSELARKRAMETDNRGAGSPIYLLHHAAVLIALVRHLGMDRKGNTVVGRVSEMERVLLTDTSHHQAPPQQETWRHDDLLLSTECVTTAPLCTQCVGMMTPGKSLSRSYTLECLYLGLKICHAQCRRHIQQDTNGR